MKDKELGVRRRTTPLLRVSILQGKRAGETLEIREGQHVIGSARLAKVQLPDPGVERRHGMLHVGPHATVIEDLGSKVGIKLNDSRLQGTSVLKDGDTLLVGGGAFKIEFLKPAEQESEPETERPQEKKRATAAERRASRASQAAQQSAQRGAQRKAPGGRRGKAPEQAGDPGLGNDQTAVLLADFFRTRPNMKFDRELLRLHRTHGYYRGDGRPERKLFVGWQPVHVLYVLPRFVQLGNGWPSVDGKGSFKEPGPHKQPDCVDDGFVVGERFNEPGTYYSYVVWQDRPYQPGTSFSAALRKGMGPR